MHGIIGGLLIFEHSAASPQDHRAIPDIKRFDIDFPVIGFFLTGNLNFSSHTILNTWERQNSTLLIPVYTSFSLIWFYSLSVCNKHTYCFRGHPVLITNGLSKLFTIRDSSNVLLSACNGIHHKEKADLWPSENISKKISPPISSLRTIDSFH